VFLYSAKLSSGAALPSFIGYSLTTNIFSWPSVTAVQQGTYVMTVRGIMNNNKYVDFLFTLTISSCDSAVITPSTQSDVPYLIVSPSAISKSVTFTSFTSNKDATQCGALTYSLQKKDSSASPPTYTALTSPPYSFNAATQQLVISTSSTAFDNQQDELEIQCWHSSQPTIKASLAFWVRFTTDCTTSLINQVPQENVTITVNQAVAATVLIPAFTTDVVGCETQIAYSCSSCTDPAFANYFTSPERMVVSAASNTYVGSRNLYVEGSIPGGDSTSLKIVVTVLPDCNFAVISGGEPNDMVRYDVSSKTEVTITPPSFQTDFTYCDTLLSYSVVDLDNQNQTADPLVFTLLPGPIIKLKTTDPSKARPYRLGLVAQVLTKKKATIINVAVSDVCPSATLVA
jgi:hypothetical protein